MKKTKKVTDGKRQTGLFWFLFGGTRNYKPTLKLESGMFLKFESRNNVIKGLYYKYFHKLISKLRGKE